MSRLIIRMDKYVYIYIVIKNECIPVYNWLLGLIYPHLQMSMSVHRRVDNFIGMYI